jgi:sortase A
MNKQTAAKLSKWQRLSLVCIILGIGFMGWSLYHIADSFLSLRGNSFKVTDANNPDPQQSSKEFPLTPFLMNPTEEAANPTAGSIHHTEVSTSVTAEVLYPIRPSDGDTIGTLAFPKLEQKLSIIQGADPEELKAGVGHFAQSVLPGENNNSVLSGHRDTVFRQLGKLKAGDMIIVETSAGQFTYVIKDTRIVHKDDKTVIVPTDHAVLTVTTCYPFNYIGDAPDRYIVTSDLVKNNKS